MNQVATEFLVDDPRFHDVVAADAKLIKLADGFRFTEGPVWSPSVAPGCLLFSDIPSNRIHRFDPRTGQLSTFREPSNNANGNTTDGQGRLVTCEHHTRRVTRTDADGTLTVLAERYQGGCFNSPNDVVVHSDGAVWFTDPTYGLAKRPAEVTGKFIYRLDPGSGLIGQLGSDFDQPNGLCFSPDEALLYVADSGAPRHIRVFHVYGESLAAGQPFCTIDNGVPDGIRCDAVGHLLVATGDGVHIFNPHGTRLGKILTPVADDPRNPGTPKRKTVANLCLGGPDGRTLYMTSVDTLLAIELKTTAPRRG